VFPLAMAESNAVIPMPERAELHRWPASQLVARRALDSAGVGLDEIGPIDLYSCFPAAVEVQAREIGVSTDRDLTLTGGMTFGGGPFNNYSLQGAAAMVRTLRGDVEARIGLTSAVSGLLTKPAVTIWSNRPPKTPFVALDLTDEAIAATARCEVDAHLSGSGVVVGATVVPARDGSCTTVAVIEIDGVRTVAQSHDATLGERLMTSDPVGHPVVVDPPGTFVAA